MWTRPKSTQHQTEMETTTQNHQNSYRTANIRAHLSVLLETGSFIELPVPVSISTIDHGILIGWFEKTTEIERRPNMVTAVNNILSAMAVSDLIVNISNIPYLAHELSDSSNITSFFSFQWAVYILVHAHVTVTAHTISIWLTCVLATWRYFVVWWVE